MQETLVFDREETLRFSQRRKEFLERLIHPLIEKYDLKTALDVGCGIGYFSGYLNSLGFAVTAFDGRSQNVVEARLRYPGVNFIVHNIQDPSAQGLGAHDLVLCFGLLYHLENPFLAIRNLYALTRRMLIVESIVASSPLPMAWLVDECEGIDQGLHHVAFISSEMCIVKMLYRAGFSYVYKVTTLPDHEQFRQTFFQERRRTIVVASKLKLDSPVLQLLPESLMQERQWRGGVLRRAMRMHRINSIFPIYLPSWLYHPLRKLKRALAMVHSANSHKPVIDLLGDRDIEWSWVATQMPSGPGEGLDFGPGELSCLALIAAQRGFNMTAVDLESVHRPYVHPQLRFIQGDILRTPLPTEHFDLVINCSTVEHVGLSGRYGVTEDHPDGDLEAMTRLRSFMKPAGTMILTIPVGRDAVFTPLHRVYGPERLPRLLDGYIVEKQEYWLKNKLNNWVLTHKEDALTREPQAWLYGIGCFVLRRPRD